MNCEIKHAYGRVYDAFWDNGWENWTRFLVADGKVRYIKGVKITKDQQKFLEEGVK